MLLLLARFIPEVEEEAEPGKNNLRAVMLSSTTQMAEPTRKERLMMRMMGSMTEIHVGEDWLVMMKRYDISYSWLRVSE